MSNGWFFTYPVCLHFFSWCRGALRSYCFVCFEWSSFGFIVFWEYPVCALQWLDKCSFCLVWHKSCHHASIAEDALGAVYIALGIWPSWVLTLALNTIYRPIACLCSMKVILGHVYVCLVLINDLMLSPLLTEGFIYHPLLTTWYWAMTLPWGLKAPITFIYFFYYLFDILPACLITGATITSMNETPAQDLFIL